MTIGVHDTALVIESLVGYEHVHTETWIQRLSSHNKMAMQGYYRTVT